MTIFEQRCRCGHRRGYHYLHPTTIKELGFSCYVCKIDNNPVCLEYVYSDEDGVINI